MEISQIRYFVAAAEELSITSAAKRLHVSQPAISRQIATLEEELNVCLFERVKKRIHLTEAGRFFLKRARLLLCDMESSVQLVREKFADSKPTFRLGLIGPFLDDLVVPAVKALKENDHSFEVSLFELSPRGQLDRVRDGQLDLAILGNLSPEDKDLFETTRLLRLKVAAVLPASHKLAKRKKLTLREFGNDGFISLSDEFFPGRKRFLLEICQSQDISPEILEESESLQLLFASVALGKGVAILPEHSAKLPHSGCVFVPLTTPAAYVEVMAVCRKGMQTPMLKSVIDSLADQAQRV